MKLSINLPTIRPELAKITIDSLNAYNCPYSYEIGVCSPKRIRGANVYWVKDPKPMTGPVHAHDLIYKRSKGEYHMIATDCQTYYDGWWKPLEDLINFSGNEKYQFIGFGEKFHMPVLHTKAAGWWIVHRDTIEKEFGGHMLPLGYGISNADVELNMRMVCNGQPAIFSDASHPTDHAPPHKLGKDELIEKYHKKDTELLIERGYPMIRDFLFETYNTWEEMEARFTNMDWPPCAAWKKLLAEDYKLIRYKEELTKAMTWLASKKRTIFLGQTVKYSGSSMFKTLENVNSRKRIELPVAEDLQMGMSIGMALVGDIPITIYPRFDFLLLALNQLVNNLDKFPAMSDDRVRPKVIIRVGVGSTKPLYPGPQHHQDHSEAFEKMLTTVELIRLVEPLDIFPAYKKAYERTDGKSTILVEYLDFYNEK